jgi:Ankyrin repeats (3 copies)
MRTMRLFVLASAFLSVVSLSPAQERDELMATPKIDEDARQPVFVEFTAEEVAEQITMSSGRNYAWFGFNTPEVHLVLPSADNSVYAVVDFPDPKLFDTAGAEVSYERERGLYDHQTHHDEFRFMPVEGEEPVEADRAVGTVMIRYPLRIRTIAVRMGDPPADGLDVDFDGPFVILRTEGGHDAPEAASFTGIEPFRALDGSGRQFEAYPSSKVSVVNGRVTETKSYWGEVAEVQVDVIDEWTTIRIEYQLPIVERLPKSRAGVAPEEGNENPPTPGAEIDVQVVVESPGMVIARELGVTPEEAVERLRELRFPQPSGEFMVMSAVQGNLEALELFLAAGYLIDFAVADGRTALNSAVMYSHIDVALFLIDAGADVNIADANNATPLFNAARNCGASELVGALIEAGADPAPATRGGTTALQMAEIMRCSDNEALILATVAN